MELTKKFLEEKNPRWFSFLRIDNLPNHPLLVLSERMNKIKDIKSGNPKDIMQYLLWDNVNEKYWVLSTASESLMYFMLNVKEGEEILLEYKMVKKKDGEEMGVWVAKKNKTNRQQDIVNHYDAIDRFKEFQDFKEETTEETTEEPFELEVE